MCVYARHLCPLRYEFCILLPLRSSLHPRIAYSMGPYSVDEVDDPIDAVEMTAVQRLSIFRSTPYRDTHDYREALLTIVFRGTHNIHYQEQRSH